MNKKSYGVDIFARVKKIWVCWNEHCIADSYEEAVNYSINNGMIIPFGDWLIYYVGYSIEYVFEMTEDEKTIIKAEYSEYIKTRIADEWTEREIIF